MLFGRFVFQQQKGLNAKVALRRNACKPKLQIKLNKKKIHWIQLNYTEHKQLGFDSSLIDIQVVSRILIISNAVQQ